MPLSSKEVFLEGLVLIDVSTLFRLKSHKCEFFSYGPRKHLFFNLIRVSYV